MNRFIGHYYKKPVGMKFSPSANTPLYELTTANICEVIDTIGQPCPFNKHDNPAQYKKWKQDHLPLVFFTNAPHRPSKLCSVDCSGYAVLDIDGKPGEVFYTDHPAVWMTNHTANGTHFLVGTCKGDTPKEWQDTYNRIAYEVRQELVTRYGEVKFDGSCAHHYQGCFLWNTELVENKNFDYRYKPAKLNITEADLMNLYNVFKREPDPHMEDTSKTCDSGEMAEMAIYSKRSGISQQVEKDFLQLRKTDFLRRYKNKYTPITGTVPIFSEYADYEGNVYEMYKTNGQMAKLWLPHMLSKSSLQKTPDGHNDYRIGIGGRKRSLYSHLRQAVQLLEFENQLSADHILYDAVYWVVNYFEDGITFPKGEIMETVHNVLCCCSYNESLLYYDKRMFVSGQKKIDNNTGEVVKMDKGAKISANAKCRKTERIIEVVKMWNPNLDFKSNLEEIKEWGDKTIATLTPRTIFKYLEYAKQMPALQEQYPWLASYEISKPKVGRKPLRITILDKDTGITMQFEEINQCMEYMGITNRKTFAKFLRGRSLHSKNFEILQG